MGQAQCLHPARAFFVTISWLGWLFLLSGWKLILLWGDCLIFVGKQWSHKSCWEKGSPGWSQRENKLGWAKKAWNPFPSLDGYLQWSRRKTWRKVVLTLIVLSHWKKNLMLLLCHFTFYNSPLVTVSKFSVYTCNCFLVVWGKKLRHSLVYFNYFPWFIIWMGCTTLFIH